jgi:hypothetical protein
MRMLAGTMKAIAITLALLRCSIRRLRRQRHLPRERHLLLLSLKHALQSRRANLTLLRPRKLGIRRPLSAIPEFWPSVQHDW